MGGVWRRRRFRSAWTARPAARRGRSVFSTTQPATSMSAQTPRPTHAASARPRAMGLPARITGRLTTGRAKTVASVSKYEVVRPEATLPPGMPAPVSIRYWSAAAAAAPPGMALLRAPAASSAVTTGNQASVRIAWS